jgi:class 3 adenylate cyclase
MGKKSAGRSKKSPSLKKRPSNKKAHVSMHKSSNLNPSSDAQFNNFSGHQKQTAINLYSSGISPDVISAQLDISLDDVYKIIQNVNKEEERKKVSVQKASGAPSLGSFYLDAVVDLDSSIKLAQSRLWSALKVGPEFNISFEDTYNILSKFSKSKATFVILNIDLVGSTRLSMSLPVDRLATIIQAFTQEMSLMISAYGGYVLKYVGDAILGFFVVDGSNKSGLHLPCINAIQCARSMIKIMKFGINPILNQYDYPEMSVRVGIDVGENAVVQYGWDTLTFNINKKKRVVKRPHLDILGYTISIASKMTSLAKPDQIVIGQNVYDSIVQGRDENYTNESNNDTLKGSVNQKQFERLHVNPEVWSYVSENTGNIYGVYGSVF